MGTGLTVYYNNSFVNIFLNKTGITLTSNEFCDQFALPDGITLNGGIFFFASVMNNSWIPTNEIAYLEFNKYNEYPRIRVKSGSLSNATIVGNFTFPRAYFTIAE